VDGMPAVLLLCGIAACVLAALNLRRSRALARLLCPGAPDPGAAVHDLPPVSVLAPCRGVDRHFERYARTLLSQDYPRYAVLFVVESAADPAWRELKRILADTPEVPASLIIAGTAQGCSQKIHNLLVGIAHVVPETSVLAFIDSDVQVHPHWLRALVTPLDDVAVGATSGYRWYVPGSGSVAGSLRSAWNAATLGLMAHPRYGFAWGGSSAIRREVFEKLRIPEAWARGLSDDLLLTQAVRTAGLRIAFVADDLVPTFEPCTWQQLVEWTNRQVTIGRIYVPRSWVISMLVHLTSLTLGALGLIAIASGEWFASVLLLSYWLINGVGSLAVCRAALRRLSAHGFAVHQRVWSQALWGPAVTALALVNMVASLATRTIAWRGISYTMRSPQDVVVHRDALAPVSSPQTS
jgi:ceramide glucosyltransferase